MNRLQACLFLRFLPRLGHISARRLWEFSKSPEAIFKQSDHALSSIEGIGSSHILILKQWKAHREAVYREEENIQKHGIQFLFLEIQHIPKPWLFVPTLLWCFFIRESFPCKDANWSALWAPVLGMSEGKNYAGISFLDCRHWIRWSFLVLHVA